MIETKVVGRQILELLGEIGKLGRSHLRWSGVREFVDHRAQPFHRLGTADARKKRDARHKTHKVGRVGRSEGMKKAATGQP
jgi:hypothetical protein